MSYEPQPIDTSKVSLSPELEALMERLAENAHDIWGAQRISDKWTLGRKRDDASKKHPCLIPYAELPESEKEVDRKMVVGAVKTILALGWRILPPEKG